MRPPTIVGPKRVGRDALLQAGGRILESQQYGTFVDHQIRRGKSFKSGVCQRRLSGRIVRRQLSLSQKSDSPARNDNKLLSQHSRRDCPWWWMLWTGPMSTNRIKVRTTGFVSYRLAARTGYTVSPHGKL